ncbi:MAG: helix-turn-helix domain-containing protein [Verrucomicrobia bacterium]|nr:helix-turn-helix domain-containing protein [Verrucomicrobiota bacterium]
MITADKRQAVFLMHQEGVSKRAIARQLRLSRNAVRHIIAQSGQMPPPIRPRGSCWMRTCCANCTRSVRATLNE